MKLTFCTRKHDALGMRALSVLAEKGCSLQVLEGDEYAPELSIVFFTPIKKPTTWPCRHTRMAAHRLDEEVSPVWAMTTPFRIALDLSHGLGGERGFELAILSAARCYEDFMVSGATGNPWGTEPTEYIEEYESWRAKVEEIYPRAVRWEMTPHLHRTVGRCSAVGGPDSFGSGVLSFYAGAKGRHCQTVSGWVEMRRPLRLVSPMCFHDDQGGTRVINEYELDCGGLELLGRTVALAFNGAMVGGWSIYTFGPDDYGPLQELGLSNVLLPYMQRSPRDLVIAEMERNLLLTQRIAEILGQFVSFPVTAGQLFEGTLSAEIISTLQPVAEERALDGMIPALRKEADVLDILTQLSPDEILTRVVAEAKLYLCLTMLWGQVSPDGRAEEAVYLLAERHGGYLRSGRLFEGPNGEFLPVAVLPRAVKQPFGPTDELQAKAWLEPEREALRALLSQ